MKISSSQFAGEQTIPVKFTCDGLNASPALAFAEVPGTAKSLALIMDDPDAPMGTFVHWVMWNIAPLTTDIAENSAPMGAVQGLNGAGKNSYIGPCPPNGEHRYFFKLYALDTTLDLATSTDKAKLEAAMQGHIIEQAELVGRYARK